MITVLIVDAAGFQDAVDIDFVPFLLARGAWVGALLVRGVRQSLEVPSSTRAMHVHIT